jgi:hypothetical protein
MRSRREKLIKAALTSFLPSRYYCNCPGWSKFGHAFPGFLFPRQILPLKRVCFDVTRVEKAINVLGIRGLQALLLLRVGEAIVGFSFVASATYGGLKVAQLGVLWSLSFSVFQNFPPILFSPPES